MKPLIDPKSVNLDGVAISDVEIRVSSPKEQRSWTLEMNPKASSGVPILRAAYSPSGLWVANVSGIIGWAGFTMMADGRITRQIAATDRVLEHLKKHCPEFTTGTACEYLRG